MDTEENVVIETETQDFDDSQKTGDNHDVKDETIERRGSAPLTPTSSGIEREIERDVEEVKKERLMPASEKKERKKRILTEKQLAVLEKARNAKKEKALLKKAEKTIVSKQKKQEDEEARINALVEKRLNEKLQQKTKVVKSPSKIEPQPAIPLEVGGNGAEPRPVVKSKPQPKPGLESKPRPAIPLEVGVNGAEPRPVAKTRAELRREKVDRLINRMFR